MTKFQFDADVLYWRGPSPFYFAVLPSDVGSLVAEQSRSLSYGWGVIPVTAVVEGVRFTTSLLPKDGTYLLPLKASVRNQLRAMDMVSLHVAITLGNGGEGG